MPARTTIGSQAWRTEALCDLDDGSLAQVATDAAPYFTGVSSRS